MAEKVTKEVEGVVRVKDEASEPLTLIHVHVRDTTERAISGFATASRALANFGSVMTQVSIMSFVYNLIQRRIEHSTVAVEEATRRYQEALLKYGESSDKTSSALRKLNLAQQDLSRSQKEAVLNQAVLFVQGGLLFVRFIQMGYALNEYMVKTHGATLADILHIGVLKTKIALLAAATFGIGAVTAALAMYAMQAQTTAILGATPTAGTMGGITISQSANITVKDERDIDEAYRQMSTEVKSELRRSVP